MRPSEQNTRIFAFITDRCRNTCQYCFVYREDKKNDMTVEQFRHLCEIGKDKYRYLTFIGGEPLLHPNLHQLALIAINKGFKISISTSGIENYNQNIDQIFSLPIDDVTVSLDSFNEKTNDCLRGVGSYNRAVETIKYLISKNIACRVTATICRNNIDDVFHLAEFVKDLGAFQLDLHVMSKKGRAEGRNDLELSPAEWYGVRCMLDNKKFPEPFNISYPIMWYKGDEFEALKNYCDASNGSRLSVMSNCECYYCTISIGFSEYKGDLSPKFIEEGPSLYKKDSNLCNTELKIDTNCTGFKYLCRFYKRKTMFLEQQN